MKRIFIALILFSTTVLATPVVASTNQGISNSERVLYSQLIDLLLQRIAQLEEEIAVLKSTHTSEPQLLLEFEDTYTMADFGGSGFFDGESFVVQEVTLQNTTSDIINFNASDLRLRDTDGTLYLPVVDSAVSSQPRFADPITSASFPTDNPDIHSIAVFPNEEVRVAVTFYVDSSRQDTEYSIRYLGGEPVLVDIDN